MHADADDQRTRRGADGQQQGGVLGGGGGLEAQRTDAQPLELLGRRCAAPALDAGPRRPWRLRSDRGAGRSSLAAVDDHDVGAVTGLAQRVGAAVDADQHRVAARGRTA